MESNVDALWQTCEWWLLKGSILTYEYHSSLANSLNVVHSCGELSDPKLKQGSLAGLVKSVE